MSIFKYSKPSIKIMPLGIFPRLIFGKPINSKIGCKLQQIFSAIQVRQYSFNSIFSCKWSTLKPKALCEPKVLPLTFNLRGFKDKDVLTKRCKDCYFQRVDGRWYVFCKTHPRHKQRQKVDEKGKWIITHETHGVKKF